MKRKYLKSIALVAFFLVVTDSFAGGPPPPPPLPIDGGILGLFGVAILYAVKKIRDIKK
jgi:hypothetical protein